MAERTPLSNVIGAFSLTIAMLIEEPEKEGAISRKAFAARLAKTADDAEAAAPEHLRDDPRLDLKIARHIASLLTLKKKLRGRWEPLVIEGGLSDRPEPAED